MWWDRHDWCLCDSLTTAGHDKTRTRRLREKQKTRICCSSLLLLFIWCLVVFTQRRAYQAGKGRAKVHRGGCGHGLLLKSHTFLHRYNTCRFKAGDDKKLNAAI